MAIALDSSTTGAGSWSHTVAGSNTILIVCTVGDLTDTLTSITYNSVAMTLVGKVQTLADRWQYMYYLLNPTAGTNTIQITGPAFTSGAAISYTGVKQSAQPDASTTNNASAATTIVTSLTVVAANSWAVIWGAQGAGTISAGTGVTQRQLNGSLFILGDSNTGLSAGSNSMTINDTPAGNLSTIMASFSPFGAVATAAYIPQLLTMGVG